MAGFAANLRQRLKRVTLIELLTVTAVIAVLIAIFLPPAKWASSGTITVPVRVLVFDPVHEKPVANAHVTIIRSPPLRDLDDLQSIKEQLPTELPSVTSESGAVVINYEFRTGASQVRPKPWAHLTWAWIVVKADGYGGVVVPVRYESQTTSDVRENGELLVTIGLLPTK